MAHKPGGGGYVLEDKQLSQEVIVKSNTELGYDVAKVGDSINYSQPSLSAGHGNAPKIIAQRGRGESGNVQQQFEERKDGNTNTLTSVTKDNLVLQINPSKESGGKQPYQQNRIYDKDGISPTIDQSAGRWSTNDNLGIRRLTEIECERLQGFPDNWTEYGIYEKQVWINKKEKTFEIVYQKHKIPMSQRYKLIGNAVTRDIIELITKKLTYR